MYVLAPFGRFHTKKASVLFFIFFYFTYSDDSTSPTISQSASSVCLQTCVCFFANYHNLVHYGAYIFRKWLILLYYMNRMSRGANNIGLYILAFNVFTCILYVHDGKSRSILYYKIYHVILKSVFPPLFHGH